jgi:hypothetical protein
MPASLWLRGLILKVLAQYRKVALEETQRVGPLFYQTVIPLNAALVLAIFLVGRGFRG